MGLAEKHAALARRLTDLKDEEKGLRSSMDRLHQNLRAQERLAAQLEIVEELINDN